MRILLPPSEAKRADRRSRAVPASPFDDPLLGADRQTVLAAVTELCRDGPRAAESLALPAGSAGADLADNLRAGQAATMPAIDRYTGVVYEGLDAGSLTAAARRRAGTAVLVFSGLLGVSRGRDPVPRYRVPASAVLPGLGGTAAAYWRPVLRAVLPELLGDGLVVDLRSTDYAGMWRPGRTAESRTIRVRVLSPRPGGGLAVVSHPSKLGKGRLARALLEQPARTVDDVLAAWERAGGTDAVRCSEREVDLVTAAVTAARA